MSLRPGDEPIPGYRLVERLGRGAFGEVWKATAPGGVGVALKFIALGGNDGLKEYRALERVKQIRHANLVSLTGIWVLDQNGQPLDEAALSAWSESVTNRRRKNADIPTLVQDPREPRAVELVVAMGLGDRDLFSRFKECKAKGLPGIPVDELLDYLEDAAKGIDYLNSSRHDLGSGPVAIQHGDIKPQNNGIEMELVLIPAGEFLMGSPESEIGRYGDETQHRVRISQPFYLCKTEVTQGQWTRVMGSEPWKDKQEVQNGSDFPAVHVSWDDAAEFCRKLTSSEQTAGRLAAGSSYRLPTEAEWECACRAGTSTRFSFGDDDSMLSDYGWWGGLGDDGNAEGEDYAHLVGQKRPNPCGLYDMHGNVWEWCSDWYGDTYYEENLSGVSVDPQGPPSGSSRVYRGGGWSYQAVRCRSAYRLRYAPGDRLGRLGFRVALVSSGE